VYFFRRNVLGGAVFPPRSVDTTLTFALTHEIWSYGSRLASLRRFAQAIYDHTVPGGVWVNSDVCGPDDPSRALLLSLSTSDGVAASPDVAALSSRARLDRFAADVAFPFSYKPVPDRPDTVELTLADAMDYLTRKDYTVNWESETREQFCGMSFAGWVSLLRSVGFEVDPASRAYRNDWIVENRIAPVASLTDGDGRPVDWPVTHVLLVARRPKGS
jgi:hypothetical protein